MSDPSNFVRSPPSVIVKVLNTSQPSINGQLGLVIQFNQDRGRYLVHIAQTQQTISLKPENLVQGNMIDQVKAQYLLLSKDPRVQQEVQKYYSLAQSKLPSTVKPEQAAIGLGLLVLLGMYFFGFTRVLMMITMILLLGVIIGPDVVAGGRVNFNWRIIAANFPSRCRGLIEQTMPMVQGKVSDKVATGIIVMLLLFSARAIFLPLASRSVPTSPPPKFAERNTFSREAAYKLGYDDASLGKEFGTSLTESSAELPSSSIYDDYGTDFSAYAHPRPWYSKLGMWQIMSIFNIGRTLSELGSDSATGTFSPSVAIMNLRIAPPMKLGLLAFSIYNVVKVFF
jgi:hypothetical protein